MNRKHFSYLFRRYLNDQATEKEIMQLMRIVKSGRYDEWIRNQIDGGLDGKFQNSFEGDVDMPGDKASDLLQNILEMAPKKTADNEMRFHSLRRDEYSPSKTAWRWVAAAVVILLAGFSWLYMGGAAKDWNTLGVQETAMQEIITNRGERNSLILADGSRITLNADSHLQIPLDYGQHSRTLILDGEAFFEVEHNPDSPFRVYTGDHVYTEVLGTRFNVRSYETASNGRVDVVVADGLVRLGSEDQSQPNSVEISAGQKGAIGPAGAISVSSVSDSALDIYLGWTHGRMVFSDHTLEEIIGDLERWYDIEITVTEPALLQRRMSATFDDDPLSEVLQVIGHALQIEFTKKKRQVRFFY
jgi:transmembrane sensor